MCSIIDVEWVDKRRYVYVCRWGLKDAHSFTKLTLHNNHHAYADAHQLSRDAGFAFDI